MTAKPTFQKILKKILDRNSEAISTKEPKGMYMLLGNWLNQSKVHWKNNGMTGFTKHLKIINLNVSDVDSQIKRHRLVDWIKTQNVNTDYLQETHFIQKEVHRLKVKE